MTTIVSINAPAAAANDWYRSIGVGVVSSAIARVEFTNVQVIRSRTASMHHEAGFTFSRTVTVLRARDEQGRTVNLLHVGNGKSAPKAFLHVAFKATITGSAILPDTHEPALMVNRPLAHHTTPRQY